MDKEIIKNIIEGCRRNDRTAQEKLYRIYFDDMMILCRRFCNDDDVAMSVLNDGFLKVFKKIDLYQYTGNFGGWIRKIMHNTMLDYLRSNKAYTTNIILYDQIYENVTHDTPKEDMDYIFRLVDKLPETTRSVFTRYAIEGYSHREIAEEMGLNENTSKWHLYEARKKLKSWLDLKNFNQKLG